MNAGAHGRNITPVERFWAFVRVSDGCWEWAGARGREGYGVFSLTSGQNLLAHRASFEMACGPVPDGLSVLHACDNPPCVRPSHLFLGTVRDNIADAVAKGRMNYGARNAWTTAPARMAARRPPLTVPAAQVVELRRLFAAGESMGAIGKRLGITTSGVSRILNGQRRRSVA